MRWCHACAPVSVAGAHELRRPSKCHETGDPKALAPARCPSRTSSRASSETGCGGNPVAGFRALARRDGALIEPIPIHSAFTLTRQQHEGDTGNPLTTRNKRPTSLRRPSFLQSPATARDPPRRGEPGPYRSAHGDSFPAGWTLSALSGWPSRRGLMPCLVPAASIQAARNGTCIRSGCVPDSPGVQPLPPKTPPRLLPRSPLAPATDPTH
jgi:hypothetical protein